VVRVFYCDLMRRTLLSSPWAGSLLVVLVVAGACHSKSPHPANLVLVTVDTLRADRLGAYGHAAAQTPTADRLAREGVRVEDATVQVPQTGPSHASLFTGLLPHEHGLRDNFSPPLRPGVPTLASTLAGHGYDTAGFVASLTVSARTGLDRGFRTFDDPFSDSGERRLLTRSERPAGEVVDAALAWLERPRERPFFAWVHLFDPHAPYEPPAPFDRRLPDPYDGEVAYADQQVGRLLAFLDEAGLRESTLFVLTSDHGEGLGDHGEDEHLLLVYDSTLRVPLLLSWPGVLPQGATVPGQFRSVDLLPTLLELLQVPAVPSGGDSRAGALEEGGELPESESYAESLYGSLHFGYAPLRALRAGGWKYIDAPRAELYDLRADPGEEHNLLDRRPEKADRMRDRLARRGGGETAPSEGVAVNASELERLIALGYVAGTSSPEGTALGADPKDKIAEYQAYKRDVTEARRLLEAGDIDAALALLERRSAEDTVSFEVESMRGQALVLRRRYAEAVEPLETALSLLPTFAGTYAALSLALRETGRYDESRAVLERGLETDPENPALLQAHGILLRGLGDLSGARASLERARTLDPADGRHRLALSAVYRDQGNLEGAIVELREAVRRDPAFGDGWNALGILLAAAGQDGEAAAAFQKAHEANPRDPDALFNLASSHLRAGRPDAARPLLEALVDQSPDFPGATQALAAARRAPAPRGR
jgi:arylsulfatase A-like enzyme/tetratricopeptide (TPR) repeat protein